MLKLVEYFFKVKTIPITTPLKVLSPNIYPGLVLTFNKEECFYCKLGLTTYESTNGYAITVKTYIGGIKLTCKTCPSCNAIYWPRFYSGLMNFNNRIFIYHELLVHLLNCLTEHTTFGRALNNLEKDNPGFHIHHNTIQAYFDQLSRKGHIFSSLQCVYFPVLLNFDINRKTAFSLPQLSIEQGKKNIDSVKIKDFWDKAFISAIAEGVQTSCSDRSQVKTQWKIVNKKTLWKFELE